MKIFCAIYFNFLVGLVLVNQGGAQSISGTLMKGESMMVAAHSTGGDFTVTAFSTNTQAVLSYTAPDNSPCMVEVSESPSYSPLVNDVNRHSVAGPAHGFDN